MEFAASSHGHNSRAHSVFHRQAAGTATPSHQRSTLEWHRNRGTSPKTHGQTKSSCSCSKQASLVAKKLCRHTDTLLSGCTSAHPGASVVNPSSITSITIYLCYFCGLQECSSIQSHVCHSCLPVDAAGYCQLWELREGRRCNTCSSDSNINSSRKPVCF